MNNFATLFDYKVPLTSPKAYCTTYNCKMYFLMHFVIYGTQIACVGMKISLNNEV